MSSNTEDDTDPADRLVNLIAKAGPRRQPPAVLEEEVRTAAHAAWQDSLHRERRQRRQRLTAGWLAAAVVIIGAGIGWRFGVPSAAPVAIVLGELEFSQGDVRLQSAHVANSGAQTHFYVGDEISTGSTGGARLTLPNDLQVRLASNTRVRGSAIDQLVLVAGGLYVDSGARHAALSISTPYGAVSHVGTRYQLQATRDQLTIRVRDGAVRLTTVQGNTQQLSAQGQLQVSASGQIQRSTVTPYGDEWAWVDALAPHFNIENRSLDELLNWAATETGRIVSYADEATQALAKHTVLHGASDTFTPAQAIEVIPPTADFTARWTAERLLVSKNKIEVTPRS